MSLPRKTGTKHPGSISVAWYSMTLLSLLFWKKKKKKEIIIYRYLNSLLIIFLCEISSALCVHFLKTGKNSDFPAFSSTGIVK